MTLATAIEDRGSRIATDDCTAPAPLVMAGDNRRLQAYYVANLHVLEMPGEKFIDRNGAVALLRFLFENSTELSPADARLWCPLSLREIGRRMPRDRNTLAKHRDVADRHGYLVNDDARGRMRPAWDKVGEQIRAAALAGKIPGPPLFHEVVAETGSHPGGRIQPLHPEQNETVAGTSSHSGGNVAENIDISARGERGEAPLEGGFPLSPQPCEGTGGTCQPLLDETASQQPQNSRRQLRFDFEFFSRRAELQLTKLELGQITLQQLIRAVRDDILAALQPAVDAILSKRARSGRQKNPQPASNKNSVPVRDDRLLTWIDSLPNAEEFLTACAKNMAPLASHYDARKAIEAGMERTTAFARDLAKKWGAR